MAEKIRRFFLKQEALISTLLAVIIAFLMVGILLFATGRNPGEAIYYFLRGSFGNAFNIADTLSRAIPLIIAGVAFLVGSKCGVFNVGIEGQLLLGALASAIVGYIIKLPKAIHLPLTLLAGCLAGGLYALFPAWLKTYRKVNEILSTIMLNYPAFFFTHFITVKVIPLEGIVPATPLIEETARLRNLMEGTKMNSGFFVAILVCILAYLLLQKTSMGYEMRAVGLNKEAARYHGIPVEKRMVFSFFLSGALAGLAGAVEMAGVHYRFFDQFSPGYGYDSITVAMVGLMNPFGVIISAILFGALKTGILDMAIYTGIPRQLMTLINGIVVLFISAKSMFHGSIIRIAEGKSTVPSEREDKHPLYLPEEVQK
ncbi:MAG: ABC transporter permease [Pelolinea sp.]|nr:ABC transporter permease [Pelolinea sp.]